VVLAVDHTKFDKVSFVRFGTLDDVDIVVTDVDPGEKWKNYFESKNIKLYY
jgi:DeoR/GlpR family transcriptional regulator of sugar metabolism